MVYNNIPEDWPLMSEGITIHWHGFDMKGVQWYDGVGYLTQCPIPSGANFTYRFQVSTHLSLASSLLQLWSSAMVMPQPIRHAVSPTVHAMDNLALM